MRQVLLLALVATSLGAGLGAPEARAGTECRGLESCIRVVGPWVQVPAGRAPTYFRLSCPGDGQIVAGLDADLPGRSLDVTFVGALGGPVSPGVTTDRQVVFVAQPTAGRMVAFRPRLGCIPPAGGGGRSRTAYEPTRRLAASAPVVVRRVKTVRLRRVARQTATFACRRSERLLGFSSAIAFRTAKAPTAAQLAAVRSTVRRRGRLVEATVVGRPPARMRVELQIHAVCGR